MTLTKHQINLFKTLSELNAIAGQENEVAKFLRKTYTDLGYPTVTDNLGSIFAYKKSKTTNAPKVMVVGHMDEVGFICLGIEPNGLLKGHAVGGINSQRLLAHRVLLKTRSGAYLYGSIDAIPPHLMTEEDAKKPVQIKDMLFDFGYKSDEEAKNAGVYIGAMMVVEGSFRLLNDGKRLLGKAFDDRYGIVLGIELLEKLKNVELDVDLYVGGSVQEEVGTRGAETATYLIKPDLAIVLDTSPARDSTGDKKALGQLGGGVLLRYVDRSMIAFPELLAYQEKAVEKTKVKCQFFDSPGGTDAGIIHKSVGGVLTLTHCLCARNIHTCSTVLDVEDYLAAQKSLLWMIKDLNGAKIERFKKVRQS